MENTTRFWLYKPKNNDLYENVDESTKDEIIEDLGGEWYIFTSQPTQEELNKIFLEYNYA